MSKAVLFSIKPKYCELIASGKKTVEVRKTKPKLDTPFKCYIYETKALYKPNGCNHLFKGEGKVIGEFVCDNIIKFAADKKADNIKLSNMGLLSCLSSLELENYAGDKYYLYGFHISDLVIYDKPRELSDFRKPCIYGEESDVSCFLCDKSGYRPDMHIDCFNEVTRPPQSWCYVEELI